MKAYSQDLRERVLAFVDEGNLLGDAVETFKVSGSWLRCLLRQREEKGHIEPKPHAGGNPGKFSADDLALLKQLCEAHPDAYLRELAELLAEAGGPQVQVSTLHNRLKELGLTRKKKPSTPPNKTPPTSRLSEPPSARPLPSSTQGRW